MLTIARQMRSEGHTVVFVCSAPAKITKVIPANGFRLINIRPSLYTLGFFLLPFTSGYLETFMAIRLFFSGLYHYTRALGQVLDELRPDTVVSDFAFPGACLAAEGKNIPYVIIYHAGLSFRGPGIPPFGSGLFTYR
jgi:UDP:flavonoid glycosyltransferase YjiC (YdhE family)